MSILLISPLASLFKKLISPQVIYTVINTVVKIGSGKQIVERMLVNERKKSSNKIAVVLAGLLAVLAVLGYVFKDKLFGGNKTTIVNAGDSTLKNKKSPELISKENNNKVVQIEFGWQLFDANTGMELWHEYWPVKGRDGVTRHFAAYIENTQGQIEPFIDIQKNVNFGAPVGYATARGSGFVVSQDGFILTNRHIGAAWSTRYDFPSDAFPGVLIRYVGNVPVLVPGRTVTYQEVFGWIPAETQLAGGFTQWKGSIKGRNTYMDVIFSGTSLRRPALQPTQASDDHDVAMIKISLPESLSPVTMFDNYDKIKPGQSVTVMGYLGIAPQEFGARGSNDPFNRHVKITAIPTATVTTGSVGRIIPGAPAFSAKNITYGTFGDSYQVIINDTGSGNSGGPLFDDKGRVVGIYYAGVSDVNGTRISFAVPIKYGLELMDRKKVNN